MPAYHSTGRVRASLAGQFGLKKEPPVLIGGNDAVLAIAGFGQASLTAAKKKLRALGYEIPAIAA